MTENTAVPHDGESFTSFAFALWMVALILFLTLEALFVPNFAQVFASVEVELPSATMFFLDLGGALREPVGLGIALVLAALTVFPFFRGRRDRVLGKRYLKAAIALLVITGFAFTAVFVPVYSLKQKLDADEPMHSSPR